MTRDEIFEVWAPVKGVWSPWCKPVLFAHMDGEAPRAAPELGAETASLDFEGVPGRSERVAVVVDLPGARSVGVALALAERLRYRPVPLFNAAPAPTPGQPVVVEVYPILAALWHGTASLGKILLEPQAPPIFLLDSNRRDGSLSAETFDNRSVSFPTDFPSANRLLAAGIRRALVIQATDGAVAPDLAHTLRRWQEAGIVLLQKGLDSVGGARPLDVPKPSLFRLALHRMLELAGLHRNILGGFGGFPPEEGGFGAGG